MRQSALIAALVASAYALDNGVGPLGFHDVNLPTSGRCLSYPMSTSRDETMQFFLCEFPPNHIGIWVGNVKSPYEIQPWLVGDEVWWFNISGISERDDIWPGRVNHQH